MNWKWFNFVRWRTKYKKQGGTTTRLPVNRPHNKLSSPQMRWHATGAALSWSFCKDRCRCRKNYIRRIFHCTNYLQRKEKEGSRMIFAISQHLCVCGVIFVSHNTTQIYSSLPSQNSLCVIPTFYSATAHNSHTTIYYSTTGTTDFSRRRKKK